MYAEPSTTVHSKPMGVSTLTVRGLRIKAHVGWSETEREVAQPVEVDAVIRFSEIPPACYSDELSHTLCYAELSKMIQNRVAEGSFKLLERMAYTLHQALKVRLPSQSLCWIRVTKLHPPVPELAGNTSFSYGDFIPEGH